MADNVKIIDKAYLSKKFQAETATEQNFIDVTVAKYQLNTEQERAFRIIANHATEKNPDQLRMYLGGMGGTGKSWVIQALMTFFEMRDESHCIIVVAPTGNAASLIGGYTYHSVLGIDDQGSYTCSIYKVRKRLDGVDYMFFDEVSRLSCHNLYKISAQLAKVYNESNIPFGDYESLILIKAHFFDLGFDVSNFLIPKISIIYHGNNIYLP